MIHRCRHCGICAGGLVRSHCEPENLSWPESDLCPNCVRFKDTLTPDQIALRDAISKAFAETASVREAERAGERIEQGLMEMRLK